VSVKAVEEHEVYDLVVETHVALNHIHNAKAA
jgi:hypothetical protein